MWPFRKRKPVSKAKKAMEHMVTGLVIGGAIGSIIGKKLLDEEEENELSEGEADESADDVV